MWISVHHLCAYCLSLQKEAIGSLRILVKDGCELPCRCWASNLCLLENQSVLLTTEQSDPSNPTSELCILFHCSMSLPLANTKVLIDVAP